MKIFKIHLPVYEDTIIFWYGTAKEANKRIKETRWKNENITFSDKSAKTLYEKGWYPIIFIDRTDNKFRKIGTLAHEILHTVTYILNEMDIKFDVNNHEVFAYTVGYLVEIATKELKLLNH